MGEIFLQTSPKTDHQYALSELFDAFYTHLVGKPCRVFAAPFDIRISRRENDINVVQPDLMIICDLKEHLRADGYYYGVPDIIVEILSKGTKRNDLIKKMNLYLEGGVEEYWLVDPETKQVTIYQFENREITKNITFLEDQEVVSFISPEFKVDLSTVFL